MKKFLWQATVAIGFILGIIGAAMAIVGGQLVSKGIDRV